MWDAQVCLSCCTTPAVVRLLPALCRDASAPTHHASTSGRRQPSKLYPRDRSDEANASWYEPCVID